MSHAVSVTKSAREMDARFLTADMSRPAAGAPR